VWWIGGWGAHRLGRRRSLAGGAPRTPPLLPGWEHTRRLGTPGSVFVIFETDKRIGTIEKLGQIWNGGKEFGSENLHTRGGIKFQGDCFRSKKAERKGRHQDARGGGGGGV